MILINSDVWKLAGLNGVSKCLVNVIKERPTSPVAYDEKILHHYIHHVPHIQRTLLPTNFPVPSG
jgi:hypothetical protein